MLYLLASWLAFVLVAGAGTAFAARGDPQMKLTPADNARSRSMLLKRSDFGPGFKPRPLGRADDFYCRGLDESDLTVTGKAASPIFLGLPLVTSLAEIYESLADANASWRRATSSAGRACLRELSRQQIQGATTRFVSFKRITLPPLAQRSFAFRIVGQDENGVQIFSDVVALQQSRASVALSFGSVLAPVPRSTVVRLARIVAKRMATAMRGS